MSKYRIEIMGHITLLILFNLLGLLSPDLVYFIRQFDTLAYIYLSSDLTRYSKIRLSLPLPSPAI